MKRLIPIHVLVAAAAVAFLADEKPKNVPKPKAQARAAVAAAPAAVGVYNVRDYGAVGDSTADDTAAIQAALDAAIGPGDPTKMCRRALGTVYIPAGIYKITAPLRAYSVAFLGIKGEGKSTKLFPTGKIDSVLDLNGIAACTVSDLLIEGDGRRTEEVGSAVYYYQQPKTAAAGSAGNHFSRIWIQDLRCKAGFRVGEPGNYFQVDTTTYHDCWAQGYWKTGEEDWYQNGFAVGPGAWGNCLIHNFYGCVSYGWSSGFNILTTNAAIFGGSLGQSGVDFKCDSLSYLTVNGIRSESSQRLYTSGGGPANVSVAHSLNDILWTSSNLAPDGVVISMNGWNGTLALRNIDLNVAGKPGVDLRPSHSLSFILDGVKCRGNTRDGFLAGCSPLVDIHVRGWTTEHADGSGWESATRGMAINGPVSWLGGGAIDAANGVPVWRVGDTVSPLAFKSDIPVIPPAPKTRRAQGQVTIPRGQTSIVVEHGLGGQPAPEDVDATLWAPIRVYRAAVDGKTITYRIEKPAPAAGVTFTWSATLRSP